MCEDWGALGIYSDAVQALACLYRSIKGASGWRVGLHLGLRVWCRCCKSFPCCSGQACLASWASIADLVSLVLTLGVHPTAA